MKKLNEGCGKIDLANRNIPTFKEGEHPKEIIAGTKTNSWQETESPLLVNRHWERLRK